jgi:hypothetical protein
MLHKHSYIWRTDRCELYFKYTIQYKYTIQVLTYTRTHLHTYVCSAEHSFERFDEILSFQYSQPVGAAALDAIFEMMDLSSDPDSMVSLTHAQSNRAPCRLNLFPREYDDEKPSVRDYPSSKTYIGSL